MMEHSNLVGMEWVARHLEDRDLVLVDCRFEGADPAAGRKAYEQAHLPGAIHVDMDRDLSAPVREHGGRHPLPDLGVFSLRLRQLGIGNDHRVVAYDDQGGAMASRLWWMLRFLGHKQVYVMDGGFTRWKQAGWPVSDSPVHPEPARFNPVVQNRLLVSMYDVRDRLGKAGVMLVDSREPERYRGEAEPFDRVAGHIPGAINRYWKDNLTAEGTWKSVGELKQRFADLPPDGEIIVYSGSGVTACANVLALAEAGRTDAKLYLGSWSDWISYPENPVETGQAG